MELIYQTFLRRVYALNRKKIKKNPLKLYCKLIHRCWVLTKLDNFVPRKLK